MKAFIVQKSKADLRQLYVNAPSHAWVKARAEQHGAKMTEVVDSMVNYIENAEAETERLASILFALADQLEAVNGMTTSLNALVKQVEDEYGEPEDAN